MIRQRIKAGLKRAVAQGTRLGRPKVDVTLERRAQRQLEKGVGVLKVAKMLGLGTGTVQRIKPGNEGHVILPSMPRDPHRAPRGVSSGPGSTP
jgi:DNA invertase Pin-like site-specific DNA recombinase